VVKYEFKYHNKVWVKKGVNKDEGILDDVSCKASEGVAVMDQVGKVFVTHSTP